MGTTADINKLFELIDSYKYASVRGERVELIVTPYMSNEKWDDSKRIVTIGLQGGLVRDRDSFLVNGSNVFDEIVLPQILSYYTHGDSLLKWDIAESSVRGATHKGVVETETGNLFYLETFNKALFEDVVKNKKEVDKSITYKDDFLTDNDKIWNEIIYYANQRRTLQTFYEKTDLSTRDKENVYKFIVNVAENKRGISGGTSKRDKQKNQQFMTELFKDKKKLIELGLSDRLINKISDELFVNELGLLVGAEKRIRRKLDLNNQAIKTKIDFAIEELEKVSYFDLKSASAIEFENGKYTSSQTTAIRRLKQMYSVDRTHTKTLMEEYKKYCDEVLTYLENRAINNRKISKSKIKKPLTDFEKYEDKIVDDYNKFHEIVELITKAKGNLEKYEVVVEPSIINPEARNVRISIVDGVSRNDTYYFQFTDGETFDEIFNHVMYVLNKEDPIFKTVISANYDENKQLISRDVLRETQKKNEFLIKNANDSITYRKASGLIDKFKKIKAELVRQSKRKASNKSAGSIIDKLKDIEKEIAADTKRQDEMLSKIGIVDDSTVGFDQLHHYAVKYKLGEVNKKLAIYDREKGMAYNPPLESEKRNIEFAIYWSVMTGITESDDDVVFGEKYAFNDDNKKLFDIMDAQFKESYKKGEPVDMDSLKQQFVDSGVPHSEQIYDRLFKNDHYIDYVRLYYKKSLNALKNSIRKSANDQARELINKRERAEKMDASSNKKVFNQIKAKEETSKFIGQIDAFGSLEELKKEADAYAKFILNEKELSDLKDEAQKFARAIQNANELEALKKEAADFARYIEGQIEQEKLIEEAHAFAKQINDEQEIEILQVEADKCAKDLQLANERHELITAARELAHNIMNSQVSDELKAAAEAFAREIQEANEMADIKDAAALFAREIQDKAEKEEIKEEAKNFAEMIYIDGAAQEAANEMFYKEAGEDQASRIAYGAAGAEQADQLFYREAGKDQADKIFYSEAGVEQAKSLLGKDSELGGFADFGEEIGEIKKIAEQYANDIYYKQAGKECAEGIFFKAAGEDQAQMLVSQNKEATDAVKLEKKNPVAGDKPENQELIDAYDIVESLATNDQPLSIKVKFPKETESNVAQVILSNGIGADETVMYSKEFDVDTLKGEIVPLLCELYSRDNEIIYNHQLGVPNAKKSGLAVVGKDFKTFQVSNADSEFVNFCQTTLVNSFDNTNSLSVPTMG